MKKQAQSTQTVIIFNYFWVTAKLENQMNTKESSPEHFMYTTTCRFFFKQFQCVNRPSEFHEETHSMSTIQP